MIMSSFLISGFLNLKLIRMGTRKSHGTSYRNYQECLLPTLPQRSYALSPTQNLSFLFFHLLSTLSLSLQMFSSYTNIIIPSILISLYPTTTIPLRIISRKNRLSWLSLTLFQFLLILHLGIRVSSTTKYPSSRSPITSMLLNLNSPSSPFTDQSRASSFFLPP